MKLLHRAALTPFCFAIALLGAACSKKSQPKTAEPAPAAREASPTDKMCAQLAPAITDCALADAATADEKLSPEETERVAAEHTKTMFHACRKEVGDNAAKLTGWQACLAAHHAGGSCGDLETCLAAVQ